MPATRKRRLRKIITYLTLIALIILVYSLRHQILETIGNLGKINAFALPTVLIWQALNFHVYVKLYQSMFGILGKSVSYKPMLTVSLELNFVNMVFPSGGVSGFSYFGLRMKSLDISPAQATLVQMMRFIFVFISFQILLFTGLLLLALGGKANSLMILVAGSVATLLLILTLGLAFIVGSKKRINSFFSYIANFVNRVIHLVRPKHPQTINVNKVRELLTELHENYMILKNDLGALRKPLIYSLLANVTELLTIYTMYVAFGHFVNPGAIIIAYAVANFAGLLSVLPSGIGLYEGLTTAILAAGGIPAAIGLPATVMYRIVNALTQLPPGYVLYHRALHPKHPEEALGL